MSDNKPTVETKIFGEPVKDTSPHALRELLEKNSKWSHLIYEQNKRTNKKMTLLLIITSVIFFIFIIQIFFGASIFMVQNQNNFKSLWTSLFK
jgi:hypothetical protein